MAHVKICGLTTAAMVYIAIEAGASMVGLVHFAPSPRHISLDAAAALIQHVNGRAKTVLVVVNPSDEDILAYANIKPDFIQIHQLKNIARLNQIKILTPIPVIAAMSISNAQDVAQANHWAALHPWILLDAKAPKESNIPGGNGVSFDWGLLQHFTPPPHGQWMLSGGLNPANVALAIQRTHAKWVDVSSGVEYQHDDVSASAVSGQKNPEAIRHFIEKATCL